MPLLIGQWVYRRIYLGAGDIVTVTNATATAFGFQVNAVASLRATTSGFVQRDTGGGSGYQNINATTDWIIPRDSLPDGYRGYHTGALGDIGDFTAPTSENTPLSLDTNTLTYTLIDDTPTAGQKMVIFTFNIDDGVQLQDSATWTLQADREDF